MRTRSALIELMDAQKDMKYIVKLAISVRKSPSLLGRNRFSKREPSGILMNVIRPKINALRAQKNGLTQQKCVITHIDTFERAAVAELTIRLGILKDLTFTSRPSML